MKLKVQHYTSQIAKEEYMQKPINAMKKSTGSTLSYKIMPFKHTLIPHSVHRPTKVNLSSYDRKYVIIIALLLFLYFGRLNHAQYLKLVNRFFASKLFKYLYKGITSYGQTYHFF